jgi:diguanylate cyclase (GGDEF)-like protein
MEQEKWLTFTGGYRMSGRRLTSRLRREALLSPSGLLAWSAAVEILLFVLVAWNILELRRAYGVVESETLQLQRMVDRLEYLDSELTMAASMAANTGSTRWESVYRPFEVEVKATFEKLSPRAVRLGAARAVRQSEASADSLIRIEHQVFALVRAGRRAEAQALISGEPYARSKRSYLAGNNEIKGRLEAYIDLQSLRFDQRLTRLSVLALASLVIALATAAAAAALMRRYQARQLREAKEKRQAEHALRRLAMYDGLTGLANRALLVDRLGHAVAHTREDSSALLFLDLDRFKRINDSLGHAAGDLLLVEIARRLEGTIGPAGMAARVGGDEFAVLVHEYPGERELLALGTRLLDAIERPVALQEAEVSTSASVGIVRIDAAYSAPEEVLRDADLAMYNAKAEGRGRCAVYDSTMHEIAVGALETENALRRAVERGQLQTCYQPIIRADDGEVAGWEALVRWVHPTRGTLGPAAFLPIAEDSGLVVLIDRWVLRDALAQLRSWRDRFGEAEGWYVSVNLSGRQFYSPGLVECVAEALLRTGVPASSLHLEVTESVLIDHASASKTLADLQRMGVCVDLDDFGTGYSSLSYLHRFAVNGLKIDRSFVASMEKSAGSRTIVRSVLALASSLGLSATAEGVENEALASVLRAEGCTYLQGYSYARPLRSAAAEAWFVARQSVAGRSG